MSPDIIKGASGRTLATALVGTVHSLIASISDGNPRTSRESSTTLVIYDQHRAVGQGHFPTRGIKPGLSVERTNREDIDEMAPPTPSKKTKTRVSVRQYNQGRSERPRQLTTIERAASIAATQTNRAALDQERAREGLPPELTDHEKRDEIERNLVHRQAEKERRLGEEAKAAQLAAKKAKEDNDRWVYAQAANVADELEETVAIRTNSRRLYCQYLRKLEKQRRWEEELDSRSKAARTGGSSIQSGEGGVGADGDQPKHDEAGAEGVQHEDPKDGAGADSGHSNPDEEGKGAEGNPSKPDDDDGAGAEGDQTKRDEEGTGVVDDQPRPTEESTGAEGSQDKAKDGGAGAVGDPTTSTEGGAGVTDDQPTPMHVDSGNKPEETTDEGTGGATDQSKSKDESSAAKPDEESAEETGGSPSQSPSSSHWNPLDTSDSEEGEVDGGDDEDKPAVPPAEEEGGVVTNSTDESETHDAFLERLFNNVRLPWDLSPAYYNSVRGRTDLSLKQRYPCLNATPILGELGARDNNQVWLWQEAFLQIRFYGTSKGSYESFAGRTAQGWDSFVDNIRNIGPEMWLRNFRRTRSRYYDRSVPGAKMQVHLRCLEHGLPCAVPLGMDCPHCCDDAPRLWETEYCDESLQYTPTDRMPAAVNVAIDCLRDRFTASRLGEQKRQDAAAKAPVDARSRTDESRPVRPPSTPRDPPKYHTREESPASGLDTFGFEPSSPVTSSHGDRPSGRDATAAHHPRLARAVVPVGTLQQPVGSVVSREEHQALHVQLLQEQLERQRLATQVLQLANEVEVMKHRLNRHSGRFDELRGLKRPHDHDKDEDVPRKM